MTANKSTKNAHTQLINRLLGSLPTGYTTSTVKMPNYTFETPANTKWLRVSPIEQTNTNVQAGQNPWQRKEGLFVVDIFYPKDSDDLTRLDDAEAIQNLFQNQAFGGVNCQEALIQELGFDEAWHITQVSINYYYEGYSNG